MDLTITIVVNLKKITKIFTLGILLSVGVSCARYKCPEIENQIKAFKPREDSVYTKISSLDVNDWDSLYVIQGPRFPNEVKEIIGFKHYDKVIPDDSKLYLAVKDEKVIYNYISRCRNISFISDKGLGYMKFGSNSVILIHRRTLSEHDVIEVSYKTDIQ